MKTIKSIQAQISSIAQSRINNVAMLKEYAKAGDNTAKLALNNQHKANTIAFWQAVLKVYKQSTYLFTLEQIREVNRLNKAYNELLDYIAIHNPNWIIEAPKTLAEVLILIKNSNSKGNYPLILERFEDMINKAKKEKDRFIDNENQRLILKLQNETTSDNCRFTINQIRYIKKRCFANSIELRDFLEVDNGLTFLDIGNLFISFRYNQLTFEEYQDNDYFEHDNQYYSTEDYVTTLENDCISRDDTRYCEFSEEYTNDPVDVYLGYRHSHQIWARTTAREEDVYYYNGDWYDEEALEQMDLRVDEDGEVVDYSDTDDYLESDYRDHIFHTFTDNPRFYIGLEVEKEDKDVLKSQYIEDFLEDTDHLFKKVSDGSLDSNSGYELNTPAMELLPNEIDSFLSSYPTVVTHIDGDYSLGNCGGHINLSEVGLTGDQFFDKIKGYAPLFYALNPTRIDAYWSRAFSTKSLKQDKRKTQSIAIWGDRIELRIFAAVENYNQLMWRVKLCSLICEYPTDCFNTAFFNCHSVLKTHLQEGYDKEYFDPTNRYKNYSDFIQTIVDHTLNYEGISL